MGIRQHPIKLEIAGFKIIKVNEIFLQTSIKLIKNSLFSSAVLQSSKINPSVANCRAAAPFHRWIGLILLRLSLDYCLETLLDDDNSCQWLHIQYARPVWVFQCILEIKVIGLFSTPHIYNVPGISMRICFRIFTSPCSAFKFV